MVEVKNLSDAQARKVFVEVKEELGLTKERIPDIYIALAAFCARRAVQRVCENNGMKMVDVEA